MAAPKEMQDLLNAGLSRDLVIQSGDAESFLAATEALLVRESPPPSREVAESLWDEAAQRFFRAPPRAIRSRAAFVNHMAAQRTALPTKWSNVISTNPLGVGDHIDMATVLGRYVAGERYFWIFDNAAKLSSLLWAASLQAATETGRIVRTALRMKLVEVSANLSDSLLQQRAHASLSSSVFTDGLDAFLGSFIASLGHVSKPGSVISPFEDARTRLGQRMSGSGSCTLESMGLGPSGCGLGIGGSMGRCGVVSCRVTEVSCVLLWAAWCVRETSRRLAVENKGKTTSCLKRWSRIDVGFLVS